MHNNLTTFYIRCAAVAGFALLTGCAPAAPPPPARPTAAQMMEQTRQVAFRQLDARFMRCARHPALTAEQRVGVIESWQLWERWRDWNNGFSIGPVLPGVCANLLPPEHAGPVSVSVEDKP
jgi:hypothetical protein